MLDTKQLMQTLGTQDPIKKKKGNDQEVVETILNYLRGGKTASSKELMTLTGLSKNKLEGTLKKLVNQRRVIQTFLKGGLCRYSLPSSND